MAEINLRTNSGLPEEMPSNPASTSTVTCSSQQSSNADASSFLTFNDMTKWRRCNVRLFSSCCHAPDSPKMKNTFYFLSFYFPRFFRRRECFRKVSMSGTDLFGRCLFLVSSGQKNKTLTCVIKYIKQTWTYNAQWKGHFSFSFLFIYRVSTKSKKILQKFFLMNLLRG